MAKTKCKWLNRNVADPDHVGAETLPYSSTLSIKDKIQLVEQGNVILPETAPDDLLMASGEAAFWFDSSGPSIKVVHKSLDGTVRTGTVSQVT